MTDQPKLTGLGRITSKRGPQRRSFGTLATYARKHSDLDKVVLEDELTTLRILADEIDQLEGYNKLTALRDYRIARTEMLASIARDSSVSPIAAAVARLIDAS